MICVKQYYVGPFISSFFDEVTKFRPFFYWVKQKYNLPTYICSSEDYQFLYKNENFINLNSLYDDNVLALYKDKKQLNKIIRKIKHTIATNIGINQKEINNYVIVQNIQIPEDYKIYNKICELEKKKSKNIICILNKNNCYYETLSVVEKLKNILDIDIEIIENTNYEFVYNKIKNCSLCLTNVEEWMYISNLENVAVIGWNDRINRFKQNEIWHFNNKNSYFFVVDYNELFFYNRILEKQLLNLLKNI